MSLERERSLSIEVAQVPILVLASHSSSELRGHDCHETFRYKRYELQSLFDEVRKKFKITGLFCKNEV